MHKLRESIKLFHVFVIIKKGNIVEPRVVNIQVPLCFDDEQNGVWYLDEFLTSSMAHSSKQVIHASNIYAHFILLE